jgi:hypothetical protein
MQNELNFMDELFCIQRFHEFSWMDFHSILMASNPHHNKKGYKENMKFQMETFQFSVNMFKK